MIHLVRPPTPRLPHPHVEHHGVRAPHVEHHDMDAYWIDVVHKKDKHEPKKGRVARRRAGRPAAGEEEFLDDDDGHERR